MSEMKSLLFLRAIFLLFFGNFFFANFASANVNTIISDPANVTTCGTLNQADTVYTLRNDVSSSGSCFAITAKNITLDLNGYTATYDQNAPIVVPNGDFEIGTDSVADGWDFSSAPNVQRKMGSYVKPVSVYSGNYSLAFSVPANDQQVRSLEQITLEPNTTYSISAMIYNNYYDNGYHSDDIILFAGLDDGTGEKIASRKGISWRGFQYIYKSFTTGSISETYNLIAGISGASTSVSGEVYIDYIKIQKHHLAGVYVGPASWRASRYHDVSNYGTATGAVITNGKIVQGSGNADFSDSIYVEENSDLNLNLKNLEITTRGNSSQSIFSYRAVSAKIHDNIIHSELETIASRDAFDGAVIKIEYGGEGAEIYNNTIDRAIQTGISASTKEGAVPNKIYGNTITMQTKYTNDFAIVSPRSQIYANTINCGSGNNSCRGIAIGGDGTEVFNNVVSVQQLPRNQEYNGCQASGAYGMQLESSTTNIKVYGNTVTANGGECEAYAFRANPYAEGGVDSYNNEVFSNTFIANANGQARASTIKYSRLSGDDVNLHNNVFRTNDLWIYVDGGGAVTDPIFRENRWETGEILPSPFYPFEVYTWGDSYFSGAFYDNFYGSPEDKTRFESEVFRNGVNMEPEPNSTFSVIFTDTSSPVLSLNNSIAVTKTNTPKFSFSSSEEGFITYSGSCSSVTTNANSNLNEITLSSLSLGTYSDCSIIVTDSSGKISEPLQIPEFTITYPSDNDLDKDVDIFDYNILLTEFGKTSVCQNQADTNEDCQIDIFDYNSLLGDFGKSF